MKTDDICNAYADKGVKLTVKLLDNETVLIESTSEGLTFLAEFLFAHVEDREDGTQLAPKGPGNIFFTKESTIGLYIHQVPCSLESDPSN